MCRKIDKKYCAQIKKKVFIKAGKSGVLLNNNMLKILKFIVKILNEPFPQVKVYGLLRIQDNTNSIQPCATFSIRAKYMRNI
jgi:hypothetical protein